MDIFAATAIITRTRWDIDVRDVKIPVMEVPIAEE